MRFAAYVFIIALFLPGVVSAYPPERPYEGFVVCIDPGHQNDGNPTHEPHGPGADITKPCVSSGTSGRLAGPEHEVNLDVGLRLHDLLTSAGVTVVMTRTTGNVDLCNSDRAAIANRARADLFIRLHCSNGTNAGCYMLYPALIEGWTDDHYDQSLLAAQIVQTTYADYTGIPDEGLISRTDISGFNYSDVPVILPEMYRMGNTTHDAQAAGPEFRQTLAEGLEAGILQYLDTLRGRESPTGFHAY